jgi:hypothetical protein
MALSSRRTRGQTRVGGCCCCCCCRHHARPRDWDAQGRVWMPWHGPRRQRHRPLAALGKSPAAGVLPLAFAAGQRPPAAAAPVPAPHAAPWSKRSAGPRILKRRVECQSAHRPRDCAHWCAVNIWEDQTDCCLGAHRQTDQAHREEEQSGQRSHKGRPLGSHRQQRPQIRRHDEANRPSSQIGRHIRTPRHNGHFRENQSGRAHGPKRRGTP